MDGQKSQLDIEKHGSKMMVLLILVVRILSYRRSENKETQERSILSSDCSGSLISFLFSFNLMRSFDDLGIFLRSNANFKAL